jgi:hypothetical protein
VDAKESNKPILMRSDELHGDLFVKNLPNRERHDDTARLLEEAVDS